CASGQPAGRGTMTTKPPSVVIVGRPNVGKSTLFNRLTGRRRSIVTDEPGITRDRIYGIACWEGREFEVVDTGGLLPDEKAELPREILRQAHVAIEDATQIVLVVDARAGVMPLDAELARLLRRAGKPLVIAANKVDTPQQEALAAPFFEMGDTVFPISAEHGLGVDELLRHLTRGFPRMEAAEAEEAVRVAIIGRPNVGKSTLLNCLAGSERAIVSPEPGTTRDAVDTLVRHGERAYRFIDTAGIRRKGKTKLVAEKLSVIMARKQLERADVALLTVDAEHGVTAGDATIAGYAQESGRSVIIVMNKWDLALRAAAEKPAREARVSSAVKVDSGRLLSEYERIVRARLKFLDYAPVIFLSALTGERAGKLFGLIDRVAAARQRRISTSELNRWLKEVDLERGTSPASRRVKIYYLTQASTAPPTFVLFTNQARRLHFSYERFLENQIRERFDFLGTPIRFLQRMKERPRRKRR
ncbi:MAG TPA: ribosome biogenesis GTPase Der, partial [Candidatus Acidoferrales bacterium]|nr:ribosome biogenesis GTPase Der [Candidatus Acidoferrales bacterium]